MPPRADQFRQVLGHFCTGVTVITTSGPPVTGFACQAFAALSLEPPLLIICVDKKAESYSSFEESGVFTVNILADDQEDISRRFAVSGGEKFEGVAYRRGGNGAPILHGVLAHLECKVHATFDGGDHTIYVGLIEEAETRDAKPLLFYRGGYRNLGD